MTTAAPTMPAIAEPRGASSASRPVRSVATLTKRRLRLSLQSPRSVIVPLAAPVLFALVIAPALASVVAPGPARTAYMTFIALSTAGLLIPMNCLFSGLGVIVDRQQGAMRELMVAPIRRSSIVFGNLVAAVALTALQIIVLVVASALRGAHYSFGVRSLWFVAAAIVFSILMYGLAEILTVRMPSPVEYMGAVPAMAIIPFFLAGSLFPITAMPMWLTAIAKVLPVTQALALFRYGLTGHSGVTALHNIWGLQDATTMALLSMGVLVLYAVALVNGAVRLFTKAGTS